MGVRDRDIDRAAKVAEKTVALAFDDIGAGVAGALRGSFLPGYPFIITGVQHFVRDITANFSYMVKIGTTDALAAAAVPADATRADATLHATRANLKGTAAQAINLHLTTNGGGAAEEGVVYVTYRPLGLRGD